MIWIVGQLVCTFDTTGWNAREKSSSISVLIQTKNFHGAVAIPRPDLMRVIRDYNTVGPRCVGAWLVAHKSCSYTENRIVCYVHDVDTKVVSISQVVFLGYWVKPADVLAPS